MVVFWDNAGSLNHLNYPLIPGWFSINLIHLLQTLCRYLSVGLCGAIGLRTCIYTGTSLTPSPSADA